MIERPNATPSDQARRLGRRTGYTPLSQGADCPYPHKQLALREEWFMGFGEGRELYRQDNLVEEAQVE